MPRKIYIYYIVVFLFTVSMGDTCTCKKKICPTDYIKQDVKDYCIFKPGSWWVYEEQKTKDRDSLYIKKSSTEIIDACSVPGLVYEYNYQEIKSSKEDSVFNGGGGAIGNYQKYNIGSIAGAIYFSSEKSEDSLSFLKYIGIMPSKQILDISFSQVKTFKVYDYKTKSWLENLCLAKKVGIVKRENYKGEVWNLIKYNIVQ